MTNNSDEIEQVYTYEKIDDIHVFTLKSRLPQFVGQWLKESRAVMIEANKNAANLKILHDLAESGLIGSTADMKEEAAAQRREFSELTGKIAVVVENNPMSQHTQLTLDSMERWQKLQYEMFFNRQQALDWLQKES